MSTPCLLPPVGFDDDDKYEIYALRFASMPQRRVHENFLRRDMPDGPMALDFYIWIVRNAHRTVLIDTGFAARALAERPWQLHIDPVDALARLGLDPAEIRDVVITHMHCDHAGNIERFPNARLHVQDKEVNFAAGRCMGDAHLRFPYDLQDVLNLVSTVYKERVCFHDGDSPIHPGLSLLLVPGHTPGMQAVRVMTPRGLVVLASDASHYYANCMRRSPFSGTVDALATLSSYSKMLDIAGSADRFIPGHDPKVRAFYPAHVYGGIELLALHEAPRPHDARELAQL
jgi:glyoxylase-like metal-dependent hydrolase (beta-lactamase superfamily II)